MFVQFEEAAGLMEKALLRRGCPPRKAAKVALEMARNSLEGTYTHGINRFARLLRDIDAGTVRLDVMPVEVNAFGALLSLDGQLGLGVVNAAFAMDRAVSLARAHGIGLAALRNTNHWMRAATYGLQACEAGMAAICFSNTRPNMPAWGASDPRLGNNPLALAFPRPGGHVVLDMAMSQFSYGALELAKLQGRAMQADAGYDRDGNLTRDPSEVLSSGRLLPAGMWKGAGLSLLLDLFAACLSLGNCTAAVGRLGGGERGLSQLFIAVDWAKIAPPAQAQAIADDALSFLLGSRKAPGAGPVRYPGQKAPEVRDRNLREGIPVDDAVWEEILSLQRP